MTITLFIHWKKLAFPALLRIPIVKKIHIMYRSPLFYDPDFLVRSEKRKQWKSQIHHMPLPSTTDGGTLLSHITFNSLLVATMAMIVVRAITTWYLGAPLTPSNITPCTTNESSSPHF